MTAFQAYLELGFKHIVDPTAYDHLLFIITLCALYHYSKWRQIIWLITAFTLGHSLTLALATFELVLIDSSIIELLIPATIMITAMYNITLGTKNVSHKASKTGSYLIAAAFGLIHGMGFSNYMRSIAGENNILVELFSFNLGIELGQLIIVAAFFGLYFVLDKARGVKANHWNHFWSGAGFAVALTILLDGLL